MVVEAEVAKTVEFAVADRLRIVVDRYRLVGKRTFPRSVRPGRRCPVAQQVAVEALQVPFVER